MRVFLDTNALAAAFATRGLCEDVLRVVLTEHQLCVSKIILQELDGVLVRKLKMPAAKARLISAFLRRQGEVVDAGEPAPWPERDPDDRWIVAAAMSAAADFLVTGDRDLLDIVDLASVAIVSPRGFWEKLR